MPTRVTTPILPTGEKATADTVATAQNIANKKLQAGLSQASGSQGARSTVTAAFNVSSAQTTYLADTTAGAFDGTLPLAEEYPYAEFWFKRIAGANTFRVVPRGSDTINGGATLTVTTGVKLITSGTASWETLP